MKKAGHKDKAKSRRMSKRVTKQVQETKLVPPAGPPRIIGSQTSYVGDETRHGGFGARVIITAVFKHRSNLDLSKVKDFDPGTDRYFVNDNDRLTALGGVEVGDTIEVHHWDADAGRWGFVADEVDVAELDLFDHLACPDDDLPHPVKGPSETPSPTVKRDADDTLKESLRCALDGLLTALVAVGGVPDDPPPESFDRALMADHGHEAAKQAFARAWKRVSVLVPGHPGKKEMFRLEEAATDLALAASAVAWRLGVAAGRKVSSK